MLKIILIRPGATDFDQQGRIKGTLDVPMNAKGNEQVARTIGELLDLKIDAVYCAPCQSCEGTAEALIVGRETKLKRLTDLKNVDHGLWHGKLIEEVKQLQPKVYRQWQDRPETVCPPQGEPVASAQQRVSSTLAKLRKRHQDGTIALVASEPLASIIRSQLRDTELGNLWKVECDAGGWEVFKVSPVVSN
jgi:broad specificity phosphatase PhoE